MEFQMRISFDDRVVLVTGAGRGIGASVARLASAAGATVVLTDREGESLSRLRDDLPGALAMELDVTSESSCAAVFAEVAARLGRLDCVVNCAGIMEPLRRTTEQPLETWEQVIDVNLKGSFLIGREAARVMQALPKASGRSIVFVSSITGLGGFQASNAYGVSKAGVAMMTQTMALDLAKAGIRVNAIAPGFIETAMTTGLRETEQLSQLYQRRTPLGRFGTCEEVAQAVLFLASDLAGFITGTVLRCDGGWSAFSGAGDAARLTAERAGATTDGD